ncbi:phenylalanine--tRNA ligase beta subunit, cytoplasmic isoform X3 [Cynara cardunculus var. scolymus]|uniref:phenylalanine--tRNA ligase beta subunit, cytoplasmic isoform X3 n=1 Tax=Cynara cardunculus var. scolymus TaxID=59895 RepID=UPI000D62C1F0|nr:phenylalanine--tRNA ligase beta subunit, cytoplasmic isoform X3 [Cynara cardunculus var. scolymus]
MPTISVGRDLLFEALGRTYTQDEFEELCFEFGIELDDVTTEKAIIRKEKHLKEEEEIGGDEEVIYKIDIPANRYDLLCLEGLVQSLRIFCGVDSVPKYTLADISKELMLKMHVKPETSVIRPYVVCAVLRGITFNEARYNSFIDLQDKLHQNICRRRTLVAIGTHDLDTVEGPFTYEALAPSEIEFKPLKQVETFRADKLMEFYKSDLKLKKYLHIIEDSPVFPVIYDRNRTVLSLPPIINGAHSAISLKTKNVFIECTATDLTKAKIVLNTMVTMFSVYCQRKFEVEPVEVIYSDGKSNICPELSPYHMEVSLAYINGIAGVSLEANKVAGLLNKMQLHAQQSVSVDNECIFTVSVPPTRSDVLHACDVAEDVAIAYGFNEIPKRKPASLKPLPLNQFSDLIRTEIALTGYTEVLTWILCSYKENFPMLNRKDDKSTAVIIGNPRSADFEVVRSSLMAGILKTVAHNKDHPKPIKVM